MKFHIIEVISIIAIFLSLLMSYNFITLKKGNRQSNIVFSILLFVFSILITCSLIYTHGASGDLFKIAMICSQGAFLVGPLIYIYICSITDQHFIFNYKLFFHAIPFLLVACYFFLKFYIIEILSEWRFDIRIFSGGMILIQSLVYIVFILRKVHSFKVYIKSFEHNYQYPLLIWLRIITIGYIAIWSINIQTFIVLDLWKKAGMCPYMYSLYFLVFFLFLNAII
jgi:hypothetical protein